MWKPMLFALAFLGGAAEATAECNVPEPFDPDRRGTDPGPTFEAFRRQNCPESCPFAVTNLSMVCEAKCVDQDACLGQMPQGRLCRLTGCRDCGCSANSTRCAECFEGWDQMADGSCIVTGSETIVGIFWNLIYVVLAITALCFVLGVMTFLGKFTQRLCKRKDEAVNPAQFVPRKRSPSNVGLRMPLVEEERAQTSTIIAHGLWMARTESIEEAAKRWWHGGECRHKVGLGLELFFRMQRFLIAVSGVVFLCCYFVRINNDLESYSIWLHRITDVSKCATNDPGSVFVDHHHKILTDYGYAMASLNGILWVVLLLMSWAFARGSMRFWQAFDKDLVFMEDYTLKLKGVPVGLTSEEELLPILEKKLGMSGTIHAVSISYDIEALEEAGVHTKDMIERLIEVDDVRYNWISQDVASRNLHENHRTDKDKFIGAINSGNLIGGGTAWIVFKEQQYVDRAEAVFKGVWFTEEHEMTVEKLKRTTNLNAKKKRSHSYKSHPDDRKDRGLHKEGEAEPGFHVAVVSGQTEEPGGVMFYNFRSQDKAGRFRQELSIGVLLIILMICAVGISQVLLQYLIVPYNKAGIKPDATDSAIGIAANILMGVNCLIQTLAMVAGYELGYHTMTLVDRFIYVFNTILIFLQTFYFVGFGTWRGRIELFLSRADSESLLRETAMSAAEKEMVAPDIFFKQYILNELALSIMPVVCFRGILMLSFHSNPIPMCIRRLLALILLPKVAEHKGELELSAREAELGQRLQDFLPSLEYTWIIVYPLVAFVPLFLITTQLGRISAWLFVFSIFFYVYQRYVNLWTLKAMSYNTSALFKDVVASWGFVCSVPAGGVLWWIWRLGRLGEGSLGLVLVIVAYLNALVLYTIGLHRMGFFAGGAEQEGDSFVDFGGSDPGVERVMDMCGYTWWCMNPVYVLKQRFCPDLDGYACSKAKCWPAKLRNKGFVEVGTSFRSIPNTVELSFEVKMATGRDVERPCARAAKRAIVEYHEEDAKRSTEASPDWVKTFRLEEDETRRSQKSTDQEPFDNRDKTRGLVTTRGLARNTHAPLEQDDVEISATAEHGVVRVRALVSPPPPPYGNLASWIYGCWSEEARNEELRAKIEGALRSELGSTSSTLTVTQVRLEAGVEPLEPLAQEC